MPALLSRRAVLGLALGGAASAFVDTSRAAPFVNRTGLRPGSFVWQPNLARSGPLFVVVSLREQLVHVYRHGVEIGISTCTPGSRGQRSPTGLFLVESRARETDARSGERLVWRGTAVHATGLAHRPAQRGCVHLPLEFAELLFAASEVGFAVVIAQERSAVTVLERPCARRGEAGIDSCGSRGPRQDRVSLIVSGADARAYAMRVSQILESVPIDRQQAATVNGTHVYTLVGPAEHGPAVRWLAVAIAETRSAQHLVRFDPEAPLRRFSLADRLAPLGVRTALEPGSSLMLTDAPAHGRGASDLLILANDVAPRRPVIAQMAVREPARAAARKPKERLTSAASLHDLFRPY